MHALTNIFYLRRMMAVLARVSWQLKFARLKPVSDVFSAFISCLISVVAVSRGQ